MKVSIQILHQAESIKERLRSDGWLLQDEARDSLSARHPQVTTEREARNRLHALGLLTSGALRVKFPMRRPALAGSSA